MRHLGLFLCSVLGTGCYAGLPPTAAGDDAAVDDDDDDDDGPAEDGDASAGPEVTSAPVTTGPDPAESGSGTTDPVVESSSSGAPGQSTGEAITWDPIAADGARLYFVGNSYTGNTGGLPNHLQAAWLTAMTPLSIEQDAHYYWGQSLGSMYTNEVLGAITSGNYDVCTITSGTVSQMQSFADVIDDSCGHFVVYMTWGLNPAIGGMENYRAGTASIVASMRQFETQADVRIVPSGLVYYDLLADPPFEGLREDWLYWPGNIHQNGVGIALNTYVFYAALYSESPVGIDYELIIPWNGSVVVSGDQVATREAGDSLYFYDEIVFDDEFRTALQQRAWDLTEDWFAHTTEFD
jgi:hypothetical protein